MVDNAQRRLMIRYLTGQASEQEREELERAYATDADLLAELVSLENDLLDGHGVETLDGAEAEDLQAHYLASSVGRQKSAFAKTLMTYISATDEMKSTGPSRTHFSSSLLAHPVFTMTLTMRSMFGIALMALVLVLGAVWAIESNYRIRGELARLKQDDAKQKEDARQLASQLASVEEKLRATGPGIPSKTEALRPTVAFLTLYSNMTRGESRQTTLILSTLISSVTIQLNLDKDSYSRYRVAIRTGDGTTVWERNELRSHVREGIPVITVNVPSKRFQNGDYVVLLSGATEDGGVEDISAYTVKMKRVLSHARSE